MLPCRQTPRSQRSIHARRMRLLFCFKGKWDKSPSRATCYMHSFVCKHKALLSFSSSSVMAFWSTCMGEMVTFPRRGSILSAIGWVTRTGQGWKVEQRRKRNILARKESSHEWWSPLFLGKEGTRPRVKSSFCEWGRKQQPNPSRDDEEKGRGLSFSFARSACVIHSSL